MTSANICQNTSMPAQVTCPCLLTLSRPVWINVLGSSTMLHFSCGLMSNTSGSRFTTKWRFSTFGPLRHFVKCLIVDLQERRRKCDEWRGRKQNVLPWLPREFKTIVDPTTLFHEAAKHGDSELMIQYWINKSLTTPNEDLSIYLLTRYVECQGIWFPQ